MSWDKKNSVDRIRTHLERLDDIEITRLVREADLDTLLSETRCRVIYGAHTYIQVTNFTRLASPDLFDGDEYKLLIQAVHLYQREVSRIVEDKAIFAGLRVHFQGPKLHALFYRPIDDGEELAAKALLLQLVVRDFVRSVFNPAFPDLDNFEVAGGADLGSAIGTRNGLRADRELLFLGAPANHAAKIISLAGRLRLTAELYDALPKDLQDLCTEVDDGVYQIGHVSQDTLDEILDDYGIGWDRAASATRIAADKERFPLEDITYSSAYTLIDLDQLSISNNKQVLAASLFGDISGFTAFIDAAETEDEQREALRIFHAIRAEMARVVRRDYRGIRVQYQGDRVQGLFHLPKDDAGPIGTEAVEAAVGLQSSLEYAIKECLPGAGSLRMKVGVDLGTTLVSRLGTRGHRDRICLGEAVERAALNEERTEGGEIGISKVVRDGLPDHLRDLFIYDNAAQCYVAAGLTAEKVERASRAARLYRPATPVYVHSGVAGVTLSQQELPGARSSIPSKSFAP